MASEADRGCPTAILDQIWARTIVVRQWWPDHVSLTSIDNEGVFKEILGSGPGQGPRRQPVTSVANMLFKFDP